jgi:hypothetical protein
LLERHRAVAIDPVDAEHIMEVEKVGKAQVACLQDKVAEAGRVDRVPLARQPDPVEVGGDQSRDVDGLATGPQHKDEAGQEGKDCGERLAV